VANESGRAAKTRQTYHRSGLERRPRQPRSWRDDRGSGSANLAIGDTGPEWAAWYMPRYSS
jgi:hypothetical protein